MAGFIVSFIVGVACVALGISNMRGNISTLHSYHRNRVSEQDRLPFGKRVGLGTLIVGASLMLNSILSAIALYVDAQMLITVAYAVLILGIVIGLGVCFYAMIKYNKGIF